MKLISWNVNGLRAVLRKNFLEYLAAENPDILCLQETKAGPDDVECLWPSTYSTYWNTAEKKGYSGTVIFRERVRSGFPRASALTAMTGRGVWSRPNTTTSSW